MAINRLKKDSFIEKSIGTTTPRWKYYDLRKRSLKITKKNRNEITIESITMVVLKEYRAFYKNIFIDSLNSDRYLLKKRISVTIEYFENTYIATNYDLDIYGYGDSEIEALDELKTLIVEYFEDLKDEKDLAPLPQKMMTFYREIIRTK